MIDVPGQLVLLGHPVSHSLSPRLQNAALAAAGIDLTYEAIDVAPDQLAPIARRLVTARGAGNVTVPHKVAFAALCASLSPVAQRTGAVNTFWTERGALVGDNTDVGGFAAAVRATVGIPDQPFEMTVLGAGGAASAVIAAAERWNGVKVRVWSRSMTGAQHLARRYAPIARAEPNLDVAVRGASLVVNATPVGLAAGQIPVDPAVLDAGTVAFDLVYRRGETDWVHACRACGLRASDGLPMLLEQGALAFERWFARMPDRNAMRAAVQ